MGFFEKALGAATGGAIGEDPYGGAFTSLIPGLGDSSAQAAANKANLQESALNRKFQADMSNTAYQRAMTDMKKAGLNPMLAYAQGGASAPSGSTAQVQSTAKTGLFDKALSTLTGVGSLQNQATGLQQQSAMNDSAVKLNASTAAKNLADTESKRLDNVRKKKYESLDSTAGRLSDKFGKRINSVLDMMDTNASKAPDKWNKALEQHQKSIKVLGPATGKQKSLFEHFKHSFQKP